MKYNCTTGLHLRVKKGITNDLAFNIGTCPPLSDPADGSVSFSLTPLAGSGHYLPGTVASFSCGFGFAIVGDNTSVCQSDTTWTNSQPNCHRESRPQSMFTGNNSRELKQSKSCLPLGRGMLVVLERWPNCDCV